MPLEVASFIADLVSSNPPTSDLETQGANHLQLIKSVLQNTLGTTVRRNVGLPGVTSLSASGTLGAGVTNVLCLVNTSGGAVSLTLPTLGAGDAGWEASFLKTTTDVNPIFLIPPSGTIQSGEYTGLAKCRRCIPGRRTRVTWTGTGFIAERVVYEPLGAIIPIIGAAKALPVGYEWPNGQTLSSAANYPEYFAQFGSGATVDMRGRGAFGRDDMGGTAAGRITVAGGNFDGTVSNASGGAQNETLTLAQVPTGISTMVDPQHTHNVTQNAQINANPNNPQGGPGAQYAQIGAATITILAASTGIVLTDHAGGGSHPQLPPAQILDCVLVTE